MKLSLSSRDLLREVLAKRQPRLADLVGGPSNPTLDELSFIIDQVVAAELAETGFGKDWEPNRRGYALEDLIDELNRIRWRLQGAPERKA
jgi:hypothetical protein